MPATDNLMAGLAGFATGFGDSYKMNREYELRRRQKAQDLLDEEEQYAKRSKLDTEKGIAIEKSKPPIMFQLPNGELVPVEAKSVSRTPAAKTPTIPQTPEEKAREAGMIESEKLKAQKEFGKLTSPEDKANQLNQAKLDKEKPKTLGSLKNTLLGYDSMINEAKAIKNDPSLGWATGWTSLSGNVPATGAKRVSSRIETLKAKTLLNVLSSLKQLGTNGASGFGQLSIPEGDAIKNSVSTLDKSLGKKDFQGSVDRFVEEMESRKENLISTYKNTYGEMPDLTETNQHNQALEWANANPNDPRSAAIKQKALQSMQGK